MHDGRDDVEEGEAAFAGLRENGPDQRIRGERSGGDDHLAPIFRQLAVDIAALDRDQGMPRNGGGDVGGEAVAVGGECGAGGNFMLVARGDNEVTGAAHLLMQEEDGVVFPVVGAERVGADKRGDAIDVVVRFRGADGTHFTQHDARMEPACQAASDPASPPPMMCMGLV